MESDAAVAKEAEEKERGSFGGTGASNGTSGIWDLPSYNASKPLESSAAYPMSRLSVKPSPQTPTIAEGYLLLVLPEHINLPPGFSIMNS